MIPTAIVNFFAKHKYNSNNTDHAKLYKKTLKHVWQHDIISAMLSLVYLQTPMHMCPSFNHFLLANILSLLLKSDLT